MVDKFSIKKANKQDKKSIQRFYKSQHYRAKFMGNDKCWFMTSNETIIGAVIISKLSPKVPYFLHGLVISSQFQNQGIASALLSAAINEEHSIICFAHETLSNLYLKQNFHEIEPTHLPDELYSRFMLYKHKQASLKAFAINQHQLTML